MAKVTKGQNRTGNTEAGKRRSPRAPSSPQERAAGLIDARIQELGDWRGKMLARVRKIIMAADAGMTEEWKWSVPVWSHPAAGIVCTGETYKKAVKLTFAKGAALDDPSGLFNAGLEGKVRRAVDLHEGDKLNERGLKELVRAAVAHGKAEASA